MLVRSVVEVQYRHSHSPLVLGAIITLAVACSVDEPTVVREETVGDNSADPGVPTWAAQDSGLEERPGSSAGGDSGAAGSLPTNDASTAEDANTAGNKGGNDTSGSLASDADASDSSARPDSVAQSAELLVLDVNPWIYGTDPAKAGGFPSRTSDFANGDWTKPVDYTHGTFYHRLEMRKMPTPKSMIIPFCMHQNQYELEMCGPNSPRFTGPASGAPPVVVTWTSRIDDMWVLNDVAFDWSKPRYSIFLAIRKSPDEYISPYPQLNDGIAWAGEDPYDWYPMEMRFTTVVVAAGGTFSGWKTYVGGN